MAYVLRGQPPIFSPVYNPIYYYVDSSLKNLEGFKYIVDLYSAGTTDRIARYRLFPRPVDGYGVADINQILATQTSYFIDQNLNGFSKCPQNLCNYEVKCGEEYKYNWEFTSVRKISTGLGLFSSSGTPANYIVGDQIYITQSPGYLNTMLEGSHTVLTAYTSGASYVVRVSLPWSMVPVNDFTTTGNTIYSDHRNTQVLNEIVSAGTAFNGSIPHTSFASYSASTYNIVTGSSNSFLTNMPNGYRVKLDNKMWLNLYSENTGKYANKMIVSTDYGSYKITNTYSATSDSMLTIGCGPSNLTSLITSSMTQSGTYPVFKDNSYTITGTFNSAGSLGLYLDSSTIYSASDDIVTLSCNAPGLNGNYLLLYSSGGTIVLDIAYSSSVSTGTISQKTDHYYIELMTSGSSSTSESRLININSDCFRFDNIELYFFDRLGSIIPANFELQSYKTTNVSRSEYQTVLGDLSNGSWTYDSLDAGRRNINTTVIKQLVLNTNWLTESEAEYLQQLYSSPKVFIKEFGKLWPVIVTTNSLPIPTKNNKKQIQYRIEIEYANADRIQNF